MWIYSNMIDTLGNNLSIKQVIPFAYMWFYPWKTLGEQAS